MVNNHVPLYIGFYNDTNYFEGRMDDVSGTRVDKYFIVRLKEHVHSWK